MPASPARTPSPARPRWPRRTARFRLTALYGGLFLISGTALVGITYALFERATRYRRPRLPQIPHTPAIQDLQHPGWAATAKPPGPLPQGLSQLGQASRPYARGLSQLVQVQHRLDREFRLVRALPPRSPALPQLTPVVRQLQHDQHQLAQDQHHLAHAVDQLAQAVHQMAQAGSVQAAQRAADSHQLLVNSGIALAIVAVLALLAGWLVAGRMLGPIRTITRTARRISSSSLHERLALDGPQDELKELGDTLDDLFGRLDAAFDAQRHFVAHASHELRTPLTAERNLLQVALDDPHTSAETWRCTAKELLASNDEQKDLIEALLALASSESRLDHRERLDLADICQGALARPGPDIDRPAVHVETFIRPAPLDGDPRLVERLVGNLVDNAIGHNVVGGHVHVVSGTTDGKAFLSVTNTGPVIPASEIGRLFQPFQRLDPRRTHHKEGLGLGLSIVQAIATTHHAALAACPLPGGGLSVTVTFPLPASPVSSPGGASRARRLALSRP